MGDPRRPGDDIDRSSAEERLLGEGHERDAVGVDGFGVTVENESVSNWEGMAGVPLHVGVTAWCNPDKKDIIQDGDLVVFLDPIHGLGMGVYRNGETGLFTETDDASLSVQERRQCHPDWIIGPVVYATAGGMVRRRPRGHSPEPTEPVGPHFVRGQPTSG